MNKTNKRKEEERKHTSGFWFLLGPWVFLAKDILTHVGKMYCNKRHVFEILYCEE